VSAVTNRLFTCPIFDGEPSNSPEIVYPPPPGNRESVGATMLNGVKSDGEVARLSSTKKLLSHRRK